MTVAFITGGASGIGQGLAESFSARGIDVIVADINGQGAQAVADRLNGQGTRAAALELDVATSEGWAAAAQFVQKEFGGIDWLINNAGIAGTLQTDSDAVTLAQWRRTISVNLDGVFLGCKTFVPDMKRRGSGHIVNTGSIGSILAFPRCVDYGASKFAVLALSRALRAELAEHGIGVSVLCPSFVNTGLLTNSVALDQATARAIDDDLAEIAANLASGMAPRDVGTLVLAGIAANIEHIFTNPDERTMLESPGQQISADLTWLATLDRFQTSG